MYFIRIHLIYTSSWKVRRLGRAFTIIFVEVFQAIIDVLTTLRDD